MINFKSTLLFCLLTLVLSANTHSENTDAQFRELYPKAMAGEASAMFSLGKIYLEGSSSAGKDSAKGMEFIQRAASAKFVPAEHFMVDSYQRAGLDAKALELCQHLQKRGDKYCAAKMETLVKASIPKTASPDSCAKVNEYYNSGTQTEFMKAEAANCVLLGLSNTIPTEEAMHDLRVRAADDPKAFIKLMAFMLKAGTADWDPVFVEENLPKTGLSFKDPGVIKLFETNDVTFDGCRRLDKLKRENIRARPSICRMAALSGDANAAIYVGESYLRGKDYFPEDPKEASIYIKEAAASKDPEISTDAFILLLDLYKKQNKFYEHFSTIQKEIKRNGLNIRPALGNFGFEADYLKANHPSMSLEDIQEVIAIAAEQDVAQAVKSKIGKTIPDIIKDRGYLIKPIEKDSLMMYRGKLLTKKDLEEEEAQRTAAAKPTEMSLNASQQIKSGAQALQSPDSEQGERTRATPVEAPKEKSFFEKLMN